MYYSDHIPYPTRAFRELSRFINQINSEFLRGEAKQTLENLRDILMKQEIVNNEHEFREQM